MKSHTKNLRFNHNPLNLILGTRKKQGLRIGYMEAALDGFYLNCMETGVHPEKLSKLLSDKFHCTDAISSCQLFLFLINEGDRASYSIMVPYLLSTENLNQFENTIRERFYGVDRFIQQGRNLYKFKEYIEERGEPIVWINDLERGINPVLLSAQEQWGVVISHGRPRNPDKSAGQGKYLNPARQPANQRPSFYIVLLYDRHIQYLHYLW